MKKIFILLLLSIGYGSYAQLITIKDNETGKPIEMVSLASDKPKAFAITNALGQTDLTEFKNSEKIEIRMLGYKTEQKSYVELEQSGFTFNLIHTGIDMDQVVVAGTRWNQNARDIPAKITSISPKQAALQNPQTTADLLGSSGEVFIQKSQQGGGSPMIRGFSTNRLLYIVDGVRMNTAIFRSGNLQNVLSIDAFSLEKTELLFGPGSVIYGSDAIGGVMSFQTLTPQLSFSDKVLITGKSVARYATANNEKTAHLDINVGWKKWASVTSFSTNDFGDLKMGSHGPVEYLRPFYVVRQNNADVIVSNDDPRIQRPSGYSQINLMQKIRFKPSEKWDLQYGYHFSETSEYARYDRHIRYKNGLPRYGEWSYGPQKWMMNVLTVAHTGNNKLYDQLTLRLAHQIFHESRIDRDINKNDRHTRMEKVIAISANLDFNKSLGEKHKLFYGLEAVQNDVDSRGIDKNILTGAEIPGPSRYPEATWNSYAAYLNYQFKVFEKFLIAAGARYNQYELNALFDTTFYPFPYTRTQKSTGALTGSLGAVYRPDATWIISINGATGFRSPNVDDAGKVFDSSPGAVVLPNPNLKAEYAYNAEVGIAKVFGNAVKIDVTGYYTILEDALVTRDFTFNGKDSMLYDGTLSKVEAVQNAAVASVYGIQAGFEIKLKSGFGLSSRFNYQVGEEEVNDGTVSPSRHAPPWFGVSRLTYTINKLDLQFYALYSDEKKFDQLPQEEQAKPEIYAIDKNGNPWSPGWYTLNFKVLYQLTDNFSVSGGLENLTDQRYRPYSSGIVAPGRNVILSFKANF
jgi:hemoglobin/transferrin/lactoferrin receptor protein